MNKINNSNLQYSGIQLVSLTFLRVLIAWHFLYEGLVKLFSDPAWSAVSYLNGSVGPLAPLFKSMAANTALLPIIDILNIWGLILIGLSLFVGLFSRLSIIFGIILLLFYYLAYPPFAAFDVNVALEGNYWIVNRNLIEIAALIVLYVFPTSKITGLDKFVFSK